MNADNFLEESAEDLYENAPCGYLSTRLDWTIVRVNRTFERWTGLRREELLAQRRLPDLLTPGARIYHETHYAPLLQMQGSVREVAVEFVRADGSRLPALINSVIRADVSDGARLIRTTVFDASDRRRYERELLKARREQQEIALELQRGLLTKSLPSFEGLDLDVAYRPARRGTEVGGDWYDAFSAGDDPEVWLVVGDVVGRGITAAAEMGQLRSAVRAFAATGLRPAPLLEALDRYAERHGVGRMATLVCAQLNRRTGRTRYACAGHLPPVVLRPGKRPEFIWGGRSRPLATSIGNDLSRDEAECRLTAGSTLLLYTDGLVERPSRGYDAGMDLLLAEVEVHRDKTPGVLAGALIRGLHDASHIDDVCLLVARLSKGVVRAHASAPKSARSHGEYSPESFGSRAKRHSPGAGES